MAVRRAPSLAQCLSCEHVFGEEVGPSRSKQFQSCTLNYCYLLPLHYLVLTTMCSVPCISVKVRWHSDSQCLKCLSSSAYFLYKRRTWWEWSFDSAVGGKSFLLQTFLHDDKENEFVMGHYVNYSLSVQRYVIFFITGLVIIIQKSSSSDAVNDDHLKMLIPCRQDNAVRLQQWTENVNRGED